MTIAVDWEVKHQFKTNKTKFWIKASSSSKSYILTNDYCQLNLSKREIKIQTAQYIDAYHSVQIPETDFHNTTHSIHVHKPVT